MTLKIRKPLAVHVVLQDSDPQTRTLATELYARLARGPRPTGIPVYQWMGTQRPGNIFIPPSQLPLENAVRNAIILLVDQSFVEVRKYWQKYLCKLEDTINPKRDLLLPVSICGDAHRVAEMLANINCVPVSNPETVCEDEHIFQAIYTALLRLLPESPTEYIPEDILRNPNEVAAPPHVFLCHTKSDGDGLARRIRQYIYEETQLSCFFDTHDIPHGHNVREFIETSISTSCLLAVWTDMLLDSRWCQFEILEARRQQRPVVVLDALSNQSPRIFPFLGNMPVVRWCDDVGLVLSALLLELVRTRYVHALFESLCSDKEQNPDFMLHPPDLLEVSRALGPSQRTHRPSTSISQLCVYPDPPLSSEEIAFLTEAFPSLVLHSLSEWTALRAAHALPKTRDSAFKRSTPLTQLSIGLSVSEAETWPSYGLIAEHQDDFVVDIARELILLGARLLWGGDLRPEGLGVRLEHVVRAYHQADHAPQDHIACYFAWPIHEHVDAKYLRERRAFADVVCLARPAVPDTHRAAFNALCYSLLRRQLAADSDVRIIFSGKARGYAGRYPGVVEEALETITLRRPLYIVGGFGGAARGVYDAITRPNGDADLRTAWHECNSDANAAEMHTIYNQLAQHLDLDFKVDHEMMLDHFRKFGPNQLSEVNKLSVDENERLASSQDIHEILALLVKGLSQLRQAG